MRTPTDAERTIRDTALCYRASQVYLRWLKKWNPSLSGNKTPDVMKSISGVGPNHDQVILRNSDMEKVATYRHDKRRDRLYRQWADVKHETD